MTITSQIFPITFKRYNSVSIKESALYRIKPSWFYSVNPRISNSLKRLTADDISNFEKKSKKGEVHWTKFSAYDSENLETKYQQFKKTKADESGSFSQYEEMENSFQALLDPRKTSLKEFHSKAGGASKPIHRIPIINVGSITNENNSALFEVNLELLVLSSIFWDGPVYKVCRSNWFDEENKPLSSKISEIIENRFLEVKPWTFVRNTPLTNLKNFEISNLKKKKELDFFAFEIDSKIINVLFIDETNAYIIDDVKKLNSAKLFLLSNSPKGSLLLPGVRHIKRGFDEELHAVLNDLSSYDDKAKSKTKYSDSSVSKDKTKYSNNEQRVASTTDKIITDLSKLFAFNNDDDLLEDLKRSFEESTDNQQLLKQPKKVEHVVFCVHGIGQILGSKYKNVNFINTVQQLRENLQTESKEFLNDENSKIETIPIVWRNLIDFNNSPDTDKKLGELSDNNKEKVLKNENTRFPSLNEVTIKEIAPLRYLINNTLLDILLYYENMYKNEILLQVVREINVAYRKFFIYYMYIHNEPFKGKIHLIGHSLGSAILYDILSLQNFNVEFADKRIDCAKINGELNTRLHESSEFYNRYDSLSDLQLDFNVDKYFSIGSPFGLFNLLKNKKMKSRKGLPFHSYSDSLVNEINIEKTSYPLCNDIYNLFDSCDPVAYRIEPLVNAKFGELTSKEMGYENLHSKKKELETSDNNDKLEKESNGTVGNIFDNANSTFNSSDFGLNIINKQFENIINKAKDMFSDEDFNGKSVNDAASIERITKLVNEINQERKAILKFSKNGAIKFDMMRENKSLHENYNNCVLGGLLEPDGSNFEAKIDMLMCNSSGRLDYSIPKSVYDVLIVNTLRSHVTYFENEHVAKFLLNEILFNDWLYSAQLVRDANKGNCVAK